MLSFGRLSGSRILKILKILFKPGILFIILFSAGCGFILGIPDLIFQRPLVDAEFSGLTDPVQDAGGWTIISTSADSRIIYVSTDGNDSNDGLSAAEAKQTISAGLALLRDGCPDHLLLRRGDVWYESIEGLDVSGRSGNEPIVISSYSDPAAPSDIRPQLTGNSRISVSGGENVRHVWFIGLDVYCSVGDDSSPDYNPAAERRSSFSLTGGGRDILIEDCKLSYHRGGPVIQSYGGGQVSDIKIRRCVISDVYSTNSHSSGLYTWEVNGLLVEECVFDHNGWRIPGDGGTQDGGMATMFNHNTYINQCNEVYLRGNLFLRGSSMGNKMCSDEPNESIQISIDNNFYYDGEIGISIGGNGEDEYRFGNAEIINNVFLNIGLSNHTNRGFSWALDVSDNFNTVVANNCFLNQPYYGNSHAVHLDGISNLNVDIHDNLMYRINGTAVIIENFYMWQNLTITDNIIDDNGEGYRLVSCENSSDNILFSGSRYNSASGLPYRIENEYADYPAWLNYSDEENSSFDDITYTDPSRTLEDYSSLTGGDGTALWFISQAKGLSHADWDSRLTAAELNDYFRTGFDMTAAESSVPD